MVIRRPAVRRQDHAAYTGREVSMAAGPIRFQKNISLLSGAGSNGVALSASGDLLAALESETAPFPAEEVELGQIQIQANTPEPIEFGQGSGKVRFTAKGSAFAGTGVYQDSSRVRAAIASDENIAPGVQFGSGGGQNYVLFRWGYDVQPNATGSMALGPAASASLKVEGASEGMSAS